ncbi:hypothetical protein Trydic_g10575 [Trypoxylus dichotomus]
MLVLLVHRSLSSGSCLEAGTSATTVTGIIFLQTTSVPRVTQNVFWGKVYEGVVMVKSSSSLHTVCHKSVGNVTSGLDTCFPDDWRSSLLTYPVYGTSHVIAEVVLCPHLVGCLFAHLLRHVMMGTHKAHGWPFQLLSPLGLFRLDILGTDRVPQGSA